jgi:hypothetical protein
MDQAYGERMSRRNEQRKELREAIADAAVAYVKAEYRCRAASRPFMVEAATEVMHRARDLKAAVDALEAHDAETAAIEVPR